LALQTPEPSHVLVPEHVPVSSAFVTWVQVPGVLLQRRHEPLQSALQQNPSKQKPVAQSEGCEQPCPAFFLQAPVASQVYPPVQESASSLAITGWQMPVPVSHALQGLLQAPEQQTPLLHTSDSHSPLGPELEQVSPAADWANSSQIVRASETPGSSPPATSTAPVGNRVAVCWSWCSDILPAGRNVPDAGSYSSAFCASPKPVPSAPPAMRTPPLGRAVEVA
jgi:hypothetical protein